MKKYNNDYIIVILSIDIFARVIKQYEIISANVYLNFVDKYLNDN